MTEQLHQSLSSVMDAAGDDLELPRLLKAMQASPELEQQLGEKWRRYHLVRGVIQGDLRGVSASNLASMDISSRVMQELESEQLEPAPQLSVEARSDKAQWFRGGALAASVALLVVTGVQIFNASHDPSQPTSPPVATHQQAAPQLAQPAASPAAADFNGPVLQVSTPPRTPFSPEAFTGRSLVNYATGSQALQSQEPPESEAFSPARSR